jgi:hypothetical protein
VRDRAVADDEDGGQLFDLEEDVGGDFRGAVDIAEPHADQVGGDDVGPELGEFLGHVQAQLAVIGAEEHHADAGAFEEGKESFRVQAFHGSLLFFFLSFLFLGRRCTSEFRLLLSLRIPGP